MNYKTDKQINTLHKDINISLFKFSLQLAFIPHAMNNKNKDEHDG